MAPEQGISSQPCYCHAPSLTGILATVKQGQGTGMHSASLLALRPLQLTFRLPHSLSPDNRHVSLYCFLRILILLVSIREACGCLKETQSDTEKHRLLRGQMVWFNSISFVVILFSAIDKVGSEGISLELTKGSDLTGRSLNLAKDGLFGHEPKMTKMIRKCPKEKQGNSMWAFTHISCSVAGSSLTAMVSKMERRAGKPGTVGATHQVFLKVAGHHSIAPWITQWQQAPLKRTSITSGTSDLSTLP